MTVGRRRFRLDRAARARVAPVVLFGQLFGQ
jgi:hypothetical protein